MRVAAFDLETTDLKALMGRILCCSFAEIRYGHKPRVWTFRSDRAPWQDKDPISDKKLVCAIRDELEKYDVIVGWNSKLFDLPFLQARLLANGETRRVSPHWHLDLMWNAGGSSNRIGSRKLVNVQKFLQLPESKTDIDWATWQRAANGDGKAMNKIIHHCQQDVKVLEQAYWKLLPSVTRLERAVR